MTIQQLRYVIVITDKGSLNKASEVLYVAQPSLSSAIQELEKELGIIIFNRTGRGVTLTNDGEEFVAYARQIVYQYEQLEEKYITGNIKKKFGISTQHYSFAVKSFVELAKQYGTEDYELAIRETRTREVIEDVKNAKSEIGILYLNDFNRKAIEKLLRSNNVEFHFLVECKAYVYLWKGHPLASREEIHFKDLAEYPCIQFEQGEGSSFYFSEEILSTEEYPQTIKVNDRATALNLMVGLNGYTLCSGIICEELNGDDFLAIPFVPKRRMVGSKMEIGYLTRKNSVLSELGQKYIEELRRYLAIE